MKTCIYNFTLVACTLVSFNAFSQSDLRGRPNFEHGDIVVSNTGRLDGTLARSHKNSNDLIVGVYNETTEFRNVPGIYESGLAVVKFDHSNGEVVKGDLIASSATVGAGAKANTSCMTVGVALENSNAGTQLLKILVQPNWRP